MAEIKILYLLNPDIILHSTLDSKFIDCFRELNATVLEVELHDLYI